MAWNKDNLVNLSEKQLINIIIINILFKVTNSVSADHETLYFAIKEIRDRNIVDIGDKLLEKLDYILFGYDSGKSIWDKYTLSEKREIKDKVIIMMKSLGL